MGVFDFKDFVFRSNKVLPTEYDDALSYYEVLNKVAARLNDVSNAANALADSLVAPYDSTVQYNVGDYVWYNNALYKCTTANYGAFNPVDWGGEPVVFTEAVGDDIISLRTFVETNVANQQSLIERTIAGIASPYDETHNYEPGDYVSYLTSTGAIIYKCIANTTGSFDSSKWTAVVAINELFNYVNELWTAFFENYTRTWGISQLLGDNAGDTVSQKTLSKILKTLNAASIIELTGTDTTVYHWSGSILNVTKNKTASSFNNMYNDQYALPDGIAAGERYYLKFERNTSNIQTQIYWYNETTELGHQTFDGSSYFDVPTNATGCIIRAFCKAVSTAPWEGEAYFAILKYHEENDYLGRLSETLTPWYRGQYPSSSDWNDAPANTIYVASGSNPNRATDSEAIVVTLGNPVSAGIRTQYWMVFDTGSYYYRKRTGSTWSNWVRPEYDEENRILSTLTPYWRTGYPSSADWNDAPANTIYVASGSNPNRATDTEAIVLTLGNPASGGIRTQYWFEFNNGRYHYRRKTSVGWSKWAMPEDDSSVGVNKNAKLYVKGNSIMVGSVWTMNPETGVVSHDHHPSAWGNSPYSVVALRLNIPKENVNTNILHSSTGFLYAPGAPSEGEPYNPGSFLDNIVGNSVDLSSWDYLMTHFWMGDLTNFPLGNTSSVADDGSIAGGVMTLVNYLNSNYPECRLVLVSVPPVDTSIALGGNPFTKNYYYKGNAVTIAELDTLMHTLAQREHFVYVDWQELTLSRYYQKYTGGIYNATKVNNVHANNENTYRKLGEYIAEHL